MRTLEEPKKMKDNMGMMEMGKSLPSFSVDEKQMPEIKEWKIGQRYMIEVEVEMTRISKNEWREGEPINASLKIIKVGVDTEDEKTIEAKKGHN